MGWDVCEHRKRRSSLTPDNSRNKMMSLTTCTTGISVLEPGAADIFILLIHAEIHVGDPLSEANRGDDSRNARSNDNDSQRTGFIDGTLFHDPLILDRPWLSALRIATKEELLHLDCICERGKEEQREVIQKGMYSGKRSQDALC